MEFKFIDTNGITLRAAVEGEGPLIIMVHGCPESWFSWRRQIQSQKLVIKWSLLM